MEYHFNAVLRGLQKAASQYEELAGAIRRLKAETLRDETVHATERVSWLANSAVYAAANADLHHVAKEAGQLDAARVRVALLKRMKDRTMPDVRAPW